MGPSCWYFVKDKNEEGHNILRPPTEAELTSPDLELTGKFHDMIFYASTSEELKAIVEHSLCIAAKGYPEPLKSLLNPPYYIPGEYLKDLEGCEFYLTFSFTSHTWKII